MSVVTKHKRATHDEKREAYLKDLREKFCDYLNITEDKYYTLHYELAFAWFRMHDYRREDSLPYLLSKGYHKWWGNLCAIVEEDMMITYRGASRREHFIRMMVNTNIRPGRRVADQFREEGLKILKDNPHLLSTKI